MAKIILVVLGLLLAYWLLRGYRRYIERSSAPSAGATEDMVRCERCGVHLPRSESVAAQGKHYCSVEHREQQPG
ncbi:MAG: PP0621 family protein [Betaproteobacteria bacterium]|nr:PP0621 family protein [Betaproteobacteria bacterium]MDH3438323.1 PP0621 family protein [Betaproteobacteria bacterium]